MNYRKMFVVLILSAWSLASFGQTNPAPIAASDLTGNWFNPARDGEGCNLTLEGDAQAIILTCYTYLDGKQVWLIGNGTLDDVQGELVIGSFIRTSGAQFGSAFRPEDVVREGWGTARMQFSDCNTALISFAPTDVRFSGFETAYQKIVPGPCNANRLDTASGDATVIGNWFDPLRDGEGIQVALEADGATYVASYYTYLDGEQTWLIGSGRLSGTVIEFNDMTLTGGASFGPAFDPADVTRTAWGQMVVDLADCSRIHVAFNSTLPQFEAFSTDMVKIVGGPCQAITLQGQVTDAPIANASVLATVADRSYQTLADADGHYSLRIVTRSPDEFVRLSATGSAAQPQVRFESLLGSAGRLSAEAGTDGVLDSGDNSQTDVTHFTTAQFALMRRANAGVVPNADASLNTLTQSIEGDELLHAAAVIQLVVDGGVALPAGVSDTLALVSNPEAMQALTASLPDGVLDQAVAEVANFAPASVRFAAGSLPGEYALYLASPMGTIRSVDGGAWAFLRFSSDMGVSGAVDWFPDQMASDIGGTWALANGVISVRPDAPRFYESLVWPCLVPTGEQLQAQVTLESVRWDLRRVVRGAIDTVELTTFIEPRFAAPADCVLQSPPTPFQRKLTLLAFASDPLPFTPDDLAGARMLPVPADRDAGGFDPSIARFPGSAIYDFDSGTLESPGMAAAFDAQLIDGRIHATLSRADASASYDMELRRYRSDGRKGESVLAIVTRSDGARGISAGMSVKADPTLGFDTANAPGIYRSGVELGDFPGTLNGDFPFFVQINGDAEQTATRIFLDPEFPPSSDQRLWSIDNGTLGLRRLPGGSFGGLRDRDWIPVAIDGNRVYVRERRWSPVPSTQDPNVFEDGLVEQRSNFYDIVDRVQFERP